MSALTHENLVQLVHAATQTVFETMLDSSVAFGEAYRGVHSHDSNNGVVSFIGLAGACMGIGSIACSAACACELAGRLTMAEHAAVDEDVLDAVAELTNMILGNVKTSLEERLGPMGLSIPTVIYGRNFSSRTVGKQEWTVAPFDYHGERVEVQLCLAEQRGLHRHRPATIGATLQI